MPKDTLELFDTADKVRLRLEASQSYGRVVCYDENEKAVCHLDGRQAALWLGNSANAGLIVIYNRDLKEVIRIDGNAGDVMLSGADCAENFATRNAAMVPPGTVLVIDDEETLAPCEAAYDRRVAGVISGGGEYRPGIILDGQNATRDSRPIAMAGKVFAWVDCDHSPIAVGDLLTTSATPGHAQRADDLDRAQGAILGKALRSAAGGKVLLPILVTLQ